jgi:hypothetical protein
MKAVFKKKFCPQTPTARSHDVQPVGKPTVDKQLDIHRMQCAKPAVQEDRLDLSHNHQARIPAFYSDF